MLCRHSMIYFHASVPIWGRCRKSSKWIEQSLVQWTPSSCRIVPGHRLQRSLLQTVWNGVRQIAIKYTYFPAYGWIWSLHLLYDFDPNYFLDLIDLKNRIFTIFLLLLLTILFFSLFYRECTRGGFCNFMHLKPISRELRRELYGRSRRKVRR